MSDQSKTKLPAFVEEMCRKLLTDDYLNGMLHALWVIEEASIQELSLEVMYQPHPGAELERRVVTGHIVSGFYTSLLDRLHKMGIYDRINNRFREKLQYVRSELNRIIEADSNSPAVNKIASLITYLDKDEFRTT